jgi:predicted  nucleic acid-binding Zn-ribbon protein
MSDETLDQPANNAILQALAELSARLDKRLDGIEQKLNDHDLQFEAVRLGLVQNSVAFDRLKADVLNLRADVKELTEEVRANQKTLALK